MIQNVTVEVLEWMYGQLYTKGLHTYISSIKSSNIRVLRFLDTYVLNHEMGRITIFLGNENRIIKIVEDV